MPKEMVGEIGFVYVTLYFIKSVCNEEDRREKRKIIYRIAGKFGIEYKYRYRGGHKRGKGGRNGHDGKNFFIHSRLPVCYNVFVERRKTTKKFFVLFMLTLALAAILTGCFAIPIPNRIPIPKWPVGLPV